jgi:hypothetical protein
MEKKLIVDYITFNVTPEQINESMEKNNGRLMVKGVLQRAEAKNQNGRVYPRNVLMREAKKYSDINIKERRALGELDHPDSSVVNLNNVSHNITEMHWQENDLVGTVFVNEVVASDHEDSYALENECIREWDEEALIELGKIGWRV